MKPTIFQLCSDFHPAGDQPAAIAQLIQGLQNNERNQVLLGVTGSGKTFTVAHVIQAMGRPVLVMAPNKTLAAQLYGEMKSFFPNNNVEYFVSYYDYYQPEAYVPRTDTYVEKEASINEQIDRMRHSATQSLLEGRDVIIVASVSCIYGIGSVEAYSKMTLLLKKGEKIAQKELLKTLVELQYKRNDLSFHRGTFRVRGDVIQIFPSHYEDRAWHLSLFGDDIESIAEIDSLTGEVIRQLEEVKVYANSHYVTPGPTMNQATKQIKADLIKRVAEFEQQGKLLEAQRIQQRTTFDLEMMEATGTCPGIENYSRYLSGRNPGEPPPTLFEYLPPDALVVVDESHVSVPQIRGMYRGDAVRKATLSEHGFRLPSCADNRPLKFEEWDKLRQSTIFVSATPSPWELEQTQGVITEQIIRPTGLVDPICIIRPTTHQVDDLLAECRDTIKAGHRVMVTTLTKKMAEALSEYFYEANIKARYMHSDIDTLERIEIINELRRGDVDVLIGINLLREGLDIPECALVAILDADKEGFLRSKTSLIQTIGRAARHAEGKAILYADVMTNSLKEAIGETARRREKQQAHNAANGITPKGVQKSIRSIVEALTGEESRKNQLEQLSEKERKALIKDLEKKMHAAAAALEFEQAAGFRDQLHKLESLDLGIAPAFTLQKSSKSRR